MAVVRIAVWIVLLGVGLGAQKPNVVFILCDDLGYGDLGYTGHPHVETPHIDQLAKQSLQLSSMYAAAPMCSPSRAGLLTGRSPHRAGIYDWIPHDGTSIVHLRKDEFTFAQGMQKAGYATSLFGKWHLNSAFNARSQPQPDDHGFEHWFATQFNPSHSDPNWVRRTTCSNPWSCRLRLLAGSERC